MQRLLHAVLAGDAGADLAAAVVLAIGDHRPAVVLAGLDAVDFVAALGTVLVHPQLAVGGQHRALRAAVAPAPDGRKGVGAGGEGVVGRDAAVLAHAHDLAQVAAQVLCLFLVLGAFAQRQEQAAVRLAVHHGLHDAAAKVQGAVVLGLLLENHLHLLQGGGVGVQCGTGQGGAVLAGIRAGTGLAVAKIQLAVLGKAAVQHHVQQPSLAPRHHGRHAGQRRVQPAIALHHAHAAGALGHQVAAIGQKGHSPGVFQALGHGHRLQRACGGRAGCGGRRGRTHGLGLRHAGAQGTGQAQRRQQQAPAGGRSGIRARKSERKGERRGGRKRSGMGHGHSKSTGYVAGRRSAHCGGRAVSALRIAPAACRGIRPPGADGAAWRGEAVKKSESPPGIAAAAHARAGPAGV